MQRFSRLGAAAALAVGLCLASPARPVSAQRSLIITDFASHIEVQEDGWLNVREEIDVQFPFAEDAVPGISLITESKGVSYRVRQFFLAANGRRFELEDVIVESEVEELA